MATAPGGSRERQRRDREMRTVVADASHIIHGTNEE
jgi:hypothetical protein